MLSDLGRLTKTPTLGHEPLGVAVQWKGKLSPFGQQFSLSRADSQSLGLVLSLLLPHHLWKYEAYVSLSLFIYPLS